MNSKFYIALEQLWLAVEIYALQPACGSEAVKVVEVSRETNDTKFLVDKLVLDLGCESTFQ